MQWLVSTVLMICAITVVCMLGYQIQHMPPREMKQFYLITNDNCAMKIFEEGNKEPDDVD